MLGRGEADSSPQRRAWSQGGAESSVILSAVEADKMPLPVVLVFLLGGEIFLYLGWVMLWNSGGRGVRMLKRGSLFEASESFYIAFSKVFGVAATLMGAGLIGAAVFELLS